MSDTPVSDPFTYPSRRDLEAVFRSKHGDPSTVGWSPGRRWRFGYWLPADVYEAVVRSAVFEGCSWIDVGGGHHIFPENPALAKQLVARCSYVVGVDPSENILRNEFTHERVQSLIEHFQTNRQFDLATLRMVVEHIERPAEVVAALSRLVRVGGVVILLTVSKSAPSTVISRLTPFSVHHPIKKLFWGGEPEDTFPVQYKMNSRRALRAYFEAQRFREVLFAHLDDLSTFGRFKGLSLIELYAQRALRAAHIRYPEHCLLGIYQKC